MVEYELTAESQSSKEAKQEASEAAAPVEEKMAGAVEKTAPAVGAAEPDEDPIDDIAEAYFERGIRYSTGKDVVPDLVAAHKWFNLAAQRGHAAALSYRNDLAREMTPREIAQAQREARAWIKAEQEAQAQAEAAGMAGAAMLRKLCAEAAKSETADAKPAKTEVVFAVA